MQPELAAAYHIREAMAAMGDDYPATTAKLAGIADYMESRASNEATVERAGYKPIGGCT